MSLDELKCLYENACLVKFADDKNPVIGVRGLDDPSRIIIELIFKWCMDHNFIVNALKSKEMSFNFKKKVPLICSDIESIPLVENMKVLGIIIDSRLTFLPHVSKTTSRASANLFLLLKLKRLGYRANDLPLLYQSLVLSVLTYGLEVWGGAAKSVLRKVDAVQKHAVLMVIVKEFVHIEEHIEGQRRETSEYYH